MSFDIAELGSLLYKIFIMTQGFIVICHNHTDRTIFKTEEAAVASFTATLEAYKAKGGTMPSSWSVAPWKCELTIDGVAHQLKPEDFNGRMFGYFDLVDEVADRFVDIILQSKGDVTLDCTNGFIEKSNMCGLDAEFLWSKVWKKFKATASLEDILDAARKRNSWQKGVYGRMSSYEAISVLFEQAEKFEQLKKLLK